MDIHKSQKCITQLCDKLVQRDSNDMGAAITGKESPSATRQLGLCESNEIQSPIAFPVRFPSLAHSNFSSAVCRCPGASPRLPQSNFTEANARVDSGSVIVARENVPRSQSRPNQVSGVICVSDSSFFSRLKLHE
jgi:hypothetical protein